MEYRFWVIGNSNLRNLNGVESLFNVGNLRIEGHTLLVDISALSGLRRVGWTGSPSSADFTFVGNTAATSLAPLHNLQTDPATGHAIHGNCVITNNYSFEYHNTTAWQFVQAIGGQQRIGGEITIANN